MKNAIEIGFLATAIFMLSGCAALEQATGWAYEAEVTTQVLPDGSQQSVTNWVTKPNVKTGITIAWHWRSHSRQAVEKGRCERR
jgi:hypothetical protein